MIKTLWNRWKRAWKGDWLAKAYGMSRKLRRQRFWRILKGGLS